MPLNYTPKTEQQIDEERIIPKGEYPFEVTSAEQRVGDYGEYLLLKFSLTSYQTGRVFNGSDIISLSDSYAWKLRHACEEMNILEIYERQELEVNDFLNRQGVLLIDHRISKKTGFMESYVKDYGVKLDTKSSVPKSTNNELESYDPLNSLPLKSEMQDDDVPF
jgi:hypothetical protein